MLFPISSCPSYDPHFDAAYGDCTFNETRNGCQLLDELRQVRSFSSSPLMICPLLLATIALACNVGYVFLLFTVWKREERRFQKRDIFLIQRSAISIVTLCLIYMSVFVWLTDGINYTTTAVFLSLSSTNFLYIGGSKVAQSLLLYTAVIHPLFYSTVLTVEHCIYIDVFITIVALVQGTLDGLSAASLFFPSKSIIDCSLHTCQYPLSITIIILRLIGFITVGASYCTIMVKLRGRIDEQAMRSLRINLLIVVLPAVPLMGMFIFTTNNIQNLAILGDIDNFPCQQLEHVSTLMTLVQIVSVTTFFWLLSLALDPIFNVTSDSKISSLLSEYGLPGTVRRSRSTASHLSHRSLTGFAATAAPRLILPAATV